MTDSPDEYQPMPDLANLGTIWPGSVLVFNSEHHLTMADVHRDAAAMTNLVASIRLAAGHDDFVIVQVCEHQRLESLSPAGMRQAGWYRLDDTEGLNAAGWFRRPF